MKSMDVNDKTSIDNVNIKKLTDYRELGEKIPIGSIVTTYAHPYSESNTKVMITSYSHFTPPLMIVSEKRYGSKYNSLSGVEEDNDNYNCIFYSTLSGSLEEKWFKRKELKYISTGDPIFFNNHKGKSVEELKKEFFGRMAILSSVDIELGKKRIWSETIDQSSKSKVNNLLDFLPPLGTITDVKLNVDYQKYNEKEDKIIHRKSKLMVKLRWFNNKTGKHSEEYFPMVALKLIKKETLKLNNYNSKAYYLLDGALTLEGESRGAMSKIPIRFERVIWNHYYYEYSFTNLFTQKSFNINSEIVPSQLDLSHILDVPLINWDALSHFVMAKATEVKDKWYEIEYSDKNERYTKRIIKVIALTEEEEQEGGAMKRILQANCLLRDGKVRHFRVSRIKSYRGLVNDFIKTFVG